MIHDIAPHTYKVGFENREPENEDYLLYYEGDKVMLACDPMGLRFPTLEEWRRDSGDFRKPQGDDYRYLFAIDGRGYFLARELSLPAHGGYVMEPITVFRDFEPMYQAFAGITGSQLYRWLESRKFCGVCGEKMEPGTRERSLVCPSCGHTEYPKISPAVIVAVTNGDKLLLTRYARGTYKRYALVAGYVEIGETLEDCVRREVMEEVGLKIRDIQYYKSQPWAFSDTEMVAFTAILDGDDTIRLEEEELCEAGWFSADEIPSYTPCLSVGHEMIQAFKEGKLGKRI